MTDVQAGVDLAAAPSDVVQAVALMATFPGVWALCGGWSVDAWLGRQTRDHPDIDFAIFADDQRALRDRFSGWLLNGHDRDDDDSTTPWNGRQLTVPGHIHAYSDGFNLDIQLNWRHGDNLVFNKSPRIVMPVSACIRSSPWLDRTLAPEATLYFKAVGAMNPKDEADFAQLLPILGPLARSWLAAALTEIRPGHPWIGRLT